MERWRGRGPHGRRRIRARHSRRRGGHRDALLDPAGRRTSRGPCQRPGLRGTVRRRPTTPRARPLPLGAGDQRPCRPVHHRDGTHPRHARTVARRRRRRPGRHEMGGAVSGVPIRDPPLARRHHPGRPTRNVDRGRRCGRRRRGAAPGSGAIGANGRVGPRRARRRRDVELELGDLVATRTQPIRHLAPRHLHPAVALPGGEPA